MRNNAISSLTPAAPCSTHDRVREELQVAQRAYYTLLAAVPETTWRVRARGSAWTIKEELWHIAWGMRFMLSLIRNARRGVGFPKLPSWILDPLNATYSRIRALRATPDSLARQYDAGHRAAMRLLEQIQEHEWKEQVNLFGEEHSLEYLFLGIAHHLEEHASRIRPAISGAGAISPGE